MLEASTVDDRFRWFGHFKQMPNERLVSIVYDGNVYGMKLKERFKLVWLNLIKNIFKKRKVRSLNVLRSCIIRYTLLKGAEMICQNKNVWCRILD